MKSLKERKAWKILAGLIAGIAVITIVATGICGSISKDNYEKRSEAASEARAAGFPDVFSICAESEPVTLNGERYIPVEAEWDSFTDGKFTDFFLIPENAAYIDATDGKTDGLIIYGRTDGNVSDPDSEATYGPGEYKVVIPYKIAVYQEGVDMWAVGGIVVLVILLEILLTAGLVIYFIVYLVEKKKVSVRGGNNEL